MGASSSSVQQYIIPFPKCLTYFAIVNLWIEFPEVLRALKMWKHGLEVATSFLEVGHMIHWQLDAVTKSWGSVRYSGILVTKSHSTQWESGVGIHRYLVTLLSIRKDAVVFKCSAPLSGLHASISLVPWPLGTRLCTPVPVKVYCYSRDVLCRLSILRRTLHWPKNTRTLPHACQINKQTNKQKESSRGKHM